jgi:ATPase family associated with various cellular activities (AAA)
MLQLAIKAQLPIVAVTTRDTLNLAEVVKQLSGKTLVQFAPNGPFGKNQVYGYVHPPETKFVLPLAPLYEKMTGSESTLLIVNPPSVIEPMFDAGEVPVPRPLMVKFLKAVVSDDKKAEELLRGLGGCTIKEAAELCRLTMARDASLTARGLMETRKSSFQGSRGLTQVDTKQGFYSPPEALQGWVKRERSFFLTGDDPRLRPRGLLFDGDPGTGKTAGSKWVAEQLGVPLYRFDVGGAKGKYVGQSEGAMLANLARLDQAEPCVVLIDEIEKVFGAKEHGDSGTTTTMLSQLLWWLAEHKSRVLTIMTTNNAKALPPELYREGRIDEAMVFEGLTQDEAATFIEGVAATFKAASLAQVKDAVLQKLFPTTIGFKMQETVKRYSQAALTKAVFECVKTA